jgi:hypothetical protein
MTCIRGRRAVAALIEGAPDGVQQCFHAHADVKKTLAQSGSSEALWSKYL